MGAKRREVGFLGSLAKTPAGSLVWPEGTLAVVIGIGGGTAILRSATVTQRAALVGSTLTSMGVLLGVVFSAFALLITLLSDDYLRLLDKAEGGLLVFIRPFMIAVGIQVTTLFVALGYIAAAGDLASQVEVAAFLVWSFLFSFALLDVVALARTVAMHGLTRAEQVRRSSSDQ